MKRKKSRYRSNKSLQRRISKFSGDVILIVCEGKKTEPNYFEFLKKEFKLHPAQIEIVDGEKRNAPISVVDEAINREKSRKKDSDPDFDQVWCVFDKDEHESVYRAKIKANDHDLKVALSTPCFEIWCLLHYTYTTRPFKDSEDIMQELKKHDAGYDKKLKNFEKILGKIEIALKNAQKLREHNRKTDSRNPSTDVDLLVKELLKIKH